MDSSPRPLPAARSTRPLALLGQILRRWLPPIMALLLVGGIWLASEYAVPASLSGLSGRLQGFVTIFLGIFIEALPFLMAGVIVSSVIALFITPEQIQRLSPRNPLAAAFGGSLLGLAFPVCECGSIPATRRLLRKGAAMPAGIAFALAAPVVNPVVIISTYVAFASWEMVAWRLGLTIIIATLIGLIVGLAPQRELVLAPATMRPADDDDHDHHHDHGHDHGHDHHHGTDLRAVLNHGVAELFEMSRYLVIGALLAATLQTIVPQSAIVALGDGPVLSVIVLMVLAVVLSICSTVDSFIALSFVNTFTPGAVLAFLVFGPMIDIKSTLMLTTTFNRRAVLAIAILCAQLALLAGMAVNLLNW